MNEVSSSSDVIRFSYRPSRYRVLQNNQLEELELKDILLNHASVNACLSCYMHYVQELHALCESNYEIRLNILPEMANLYDQIMEHYLLDPNNYGFRPLYYVSSLVLLINYFETNGFPFNFNFADTFKDFYDDLNLQFISCADFHVGDGRLSRR